MAKSIIFKNNNYLDTKGIVHNKRLLSDILNEILKSNILYNSDTGVVAGSSGASVHLAEPVINFGAILILSTNGWGIVDTKLNQYNAGNGVNIWWFNNGYAGTFYSNTIYKVIGIGRL